MQSRKIYFASDFHLGIDARLSSPDREKQIVRWLHAIALDAQGLYLLGDVFDFWFEYRRAVPKGYVRLMGALAELRDSGLPIHFFIGNHDMWMFRYFTDELGIPIHRKPIRTELLGKAFFIGHGDGLGPYDRGYKTLKKIFANRTCQWLFERLHPNLGIGMANYWSARSRMLNPEEIRWLGEDREWLVAYCRHKINQGIAPDYFVFGHRHIPIDFQLGNGRSRYINLGDWMHHCSFAEFDGTDMHLRFFENQHGKIYP